MGLGRTCGFREGGQRRALEKMIFKEDVKEVEVDVVF